MPSNMSAILFSEKFCQDEHSPVELNTINVYMSYKVFSCPFVKQRAQILTSNKVVEEKR